MPSASKKRRVEPASEPAPIVYALPGLKPDVRLHVLGTDYHVHSMILKLHSAFFRAFLDSPDKQPLPSTAPFQYEYSSVIDYKLPTLREKEDIYGFVLGGARQLDAGGGSTNVSSFKKRTLHT